MTTLTFDVNAFRIEFHQFSNPITYPDALLQGYWDAGTCYISDQDFGNLNGACRQHALNLMTAHLAQLANLVKQNNYSGMPGLAQSATIDKVTVSLTPPPLKNQWQWWLSLTPYGQQLYALLFVTGIGSSIYIGALPETYGFRRIGGIFV